MRALFRTVTGSPASRKEKGKGRKGSTDQYSVADVAACWTAVKSDIGPATSSTTLQLGEVQHDHASSSQRLLNGNAKQTLGAVSRNLDIIVDALVNEQSVTSSDESAGPCLEYILTNNVFASLTQSAVANRVEGLLGVVLKVFDNLVILLGDAFITYAHRPLNQLLRDCIVHDDADILPTQGGHSNSQLRISPAAEDCEEELASLLCSIASRIKTLPDLLPLFFHDKRLGHRAPTGQSGPTILVHPDTSSQALSPSATSVAPEMALSPSQSSTASSSATLSTEASDIDTPPSVPVASQQYSFLLFDFLIRLLHRHGRVGELARTGLLFIVDLAMSPATKITASLQSKSKARSAILDLDMGNRHNTKVGDFGSEPNRRRRRRQAVIGQSDRLALLSYIQDSDFADVLAAGLGAAYAVLPSRLYLPIFDITSQSLHPASMGQSKPVNPNGDATNDSWQAIRSQGIAVAIDPDVMEVLELFKIMISFAVDVTRRASTQVLQSPTVPSSAPYNGTDAVAEKMQSLIRAIRNAYCSVFLSNAVLPKIADAASPTAEDAAIVAVLTYTECLLRTLEPGNPLQEDLLCSLLTREHGKTSSNIESSSMRDNIRRIVSYCLTPCLADQADLNTAKGLLSEKLSAPIQLAALQFVQALLQTADSAALELFDVRPALGCTAFPFRCEGHHLDLAAENNDFRYPGSDQDSDATSFVYPEVTEPKTEDARVNGQAHHDTLENFIQLAVGTTPASPLPTATPSSPRPATQQHDSLASSISALTALPVMNAGEKQNFRSHILQAEALLRFDISFVRGNAILDSSRASVDPGSHDGSARGISTFSPDTTTTSNSDGTFSASADGPASLLESDTMIQHKLDGTMGTMAHIHAILTTFFANEPAVNLAVTGVVAKLATCPYRSLEGWLTPAHFTSALHAVSEYQLLESLSSTFTFDRSSATSPITGSNASVGSAKVSNWLKHSSSYHTQLSAREEEEEALTKEEDSVLTQLSRLLREVKASHREQIPDFHKLLKERRKHMLFIQDLADAMTGDTTPGDYDTRALTNNGSDLAKDASFFSLPRMPGGLASPVRSRVRSLTGSDSGITISPYAAHKRSTSLKEILVRIPNEAGREGTGFVPSPASLQRVWSASSSNSNAGSAVPEADESRAPNSAMLQTTSSEFSKRPDLLLLSDLKSPKLPDGEGETAAYREVPVNLSKYLDNLVILEESIQEIVAIIIVRLKYGIDDLA